MNLRHAIASFVAIAILVPALLLVTMLSTGSKVQSVDDDDEWLARLTARLVASELNVTRRLFRLAAELGDLRQPLEQRVVDLLGNLLTQDSDLSIVVMLDADDKPIGRPVRSGAALPGADESAYLGDADFNRFMARLPIDAARKSGQASSDVYVDQQKNLAYVAGAVAVESSDPGPAMILGYEKRLRHIQQLMVTGVPNPSYTAFIVDSGGRMVVHPDGQRFLSRELMTGHPLVARALAGEPSGKGRWRDGRGNRMAGAFQSMAGVGWTVVLERAGLDSASRAVFPFWIWIAWLAVVAVVLAAGWLMFQKATGLNRDVIEWKTNYERRAEELNRVQASLLESRKLNAIGDLGAGVAHEFNNPVGGILGLTQLLLRKKKDGDPDVEFLRRIEAEAKRCKSITDNLLRFSEHQQGDHREPIRVERVLDLAVDLMKNKLESKRIRIERDFAAGLKRVLGNEGQLQRAFINVLFNAETAMPDGGLLKLSAEQDGDWVNVHIADTGHGIAPENLERVFEPFFTTKDNWRGAGLGLWVVYQIIQEHGGGVSLESELGKGTLVSFRFPCFDKEKSNEASRVPLA